MAGPNMAARSLLKGQKRVLPLVVDPQALRFDGQDGDPLRQGVSDAQPPLPARMRNDRPAIAAVADDTLQRIAKGLERRSRGLRWLRLDRFGGTRRLWLRRRECAEQGRPAR